MRFITGADSIDPHEKIKVKFVSQQKEYLRPIAETCFKILHLPREYENFSHLEDNINFILNREDLWAVSDVAASVYEFIG